MTIKDLNKKVLSMNDKIDELIKDLLKSYYYEFGDDTAAEDDVIFEMPLMRSKKRPLFVMWRYSSLSKWEYGEIDKMYYTLEECVEGPDSFLIIPNPKEPRSLPHVQILAEDVLYDKLALLTVIIKTFGHKLNRKLKKNGVKN